MRARLVRRLHGEVPILLPAAMRQLRAGGLMPTDSERLDKLERIIRAGTLIWDGRGAFPGEGLPRLGLSLMVGSDQERSIREMIDAMDEDPDPLAALLAEAWDDVGLECRARNGVITALEREYASQIPHQQIYSLPLSAVLARPGMKQKNFGAVSFSHLIAYLRRRGVPLELIERSPLWTRSPLRFRRRSL